MNDDRKPLLTGGCQCGAVRYALYSQPDDPSICHCRMCQKASGNLFGAFAGVPGGDFAWTRGTPKFWQSSEAVARDFCGDCGTPLTYRPLFKDRVAVSIGSLDHPEQIPVISQYGIESRVPGFERCGRPARPGNQREWMPADRLAKAASRQHPDHD